MSNIPPALHCLVPGAPLGVCVPRVTVPHLISTPNRWGNWKDGLILGMAGSKLTDLPDNERFLEDKRIDFEASLAQG